MEGNKINTCEVNASFSAIGKHAGQMIKEAGLAFLLFLNI